MKLMKYRFVYKNGGWWLKISTLEELVDYQEKIGYQNPIARGFISVLNCREFGKPIDGEPLRPHVNNEGYLIGLYAQNHNMNLLQATCSLAVQTDNAKIEQLLKGNNLYFNRVGGWHFGKNDYSNWYDSDKLIFPDFKKNQIKIEKFPMGEHYYAYIDNIQVRDGDTLKWNTYEEAYNQALQYINNE